MLKAPIDPLPYWSRAGPRHPDMWILQTWGYHQGIFNGENSEQSSKFAEPPLISDQTIRIHRRGPQGFQNWSGPTKTKK
jgi:hypothetical protein